MKFGISCSQILGHTPTAGDILSMAREAEKIGYHSIMLGDHILTPNCFDDSNYPAGTFDAATPWYEPFVLLSALAGATTTIRLGTGIAVIPYRPPIQQAQAIATLDFISEGRFYYGAGIGWMREEFDALGVSFDERGRRSDEYLELITLLLSGRPEGYKGQFVDFPGGRLNPLPHQKPYPPIIIGGESPPAIRRIAGYGDGFYINWKSLPELDLFITALTDQMERNGRAVSSLYKQLATTDVAFIRAAKDMLPDYAARGVDEIIFSPVCDSPAEGMEAIKAFADEFF